MWIPFQQYSLSYACLKLVNYSFFFWLPYYLSNSKYFTLLALIFLVNQHYLPGKKGNV